MCGSIHAIHVCKHMCISIELTLTQPRVVKLISTEMVENPVYSKHQGRPLAFWPSMVIAAHRIGSC